MWKPKIGDEIRVPLEPRIATITDVWPDEVRVKFSDGSTGYFDRKVIKRRAS